MYFFSTELRKLYLQWAKSEPGVAIADYYTLFSKLMDKPERYGFSRKYLKQGCIGRRCSDNWREYIWFDDVRLLSFSRRYLLAADDRDVAVPPDDLCPLAHGGRGHGGARQRLVVELGAAVINLRLNILYFFIPPCIHYHHVAFTIITLHILHRILFIQVFARLSASPQLSPLPSLLL
jgi:hypothetical protein